MGVSAGAVGSVLARARAAGLTSFADVEALDDDALDAKIYAQAATEGDRPEPDCAWIHRERARPGVTLELLHHEYLETHPAGYAYTAFCDRYRAWLKRRGLVMRQVHVAGDKMLVDYSGKKPSIVDPRDGRGDRRRALRRGARREQLHVRGGDVLAARAGLDWQSRARVRILRGATHATVCDQLKSGVTRACRYEPAVQRTYEEMALHYGTTVLPARPHRPRDKAQVEVAVQIAQRWILARIRNETFFSLSSLNTRIREQLVDLNGRVMKRYGKSRAQLYAELDKAALLPLPLDCRFSQK